ncbi:MAG: 50S ribosomal protein L21 [Coriobacteriia bacterium]|nr:50S ribosomal protein L21 [Coriobacteriia bacterium]
MYAVVSSGGKQLKVVEGAEAVVEKLDAAVGESVELDVVFIADGDEIVVDASTLSSASVTAEVVEHFKDDKVVVFKFKKRKGYRRTKGHRQSLTRVRVTGIAGPAPTKPARKKEPAGKAEPAKASAAAEEKPKRTRAKKAAEGEAPARSAESGE